LKFRCERDTLLETLAVAGRAVSGSKAVAGLSPLRMTVAGDSLEVTGSDHDLTIVARTEVKGEVDGQVVAPARLLADIVRALDPGAVSVATEAETLRVVSGRTRFSLLTSQETSIPGLQAPSAERVVVEAASLLEALRQVTRAASDQEERPILTGVLFSAEADGLRLVATDSYRLAVRHVSDIGLLEQGQRVLIPSRALSELSRLLGGAREVSLGLGSHFVTFDVGSVTLVSRLIEGEFPNYKALIPTGYPNRLVVPKEAFLDAIRRVKLMVREPNTPVRVALRETAIELSVITTDLGEASEELDAKYEGAEMTVAFNPTYLSEGVDAVVGEDVQIETLDPLKPAVIRPATGEEFLYLIMPIRVS